MDKKTITMTTSEWNTVCDALDMLAHIDEGAHTDYKELLRLRDLIRHVSTVPLFGLTHVQVKPTYDFDDSATREP
jgi:hypothetical protein